MSTIGPQEALTTASEGEWELIGRDMIRTKRNQDGSGGMIVAQFWTAPTAEHAAAMVAAPLLAEALRTLCSPDVSYHDGEIRIPLASHGAALEAMRKAREALAKAEARHA